MEKYHDQKLIKNSSVTTSIPISSIAISKRNKRKERLNKIQQKQTMATMTRRKQKQLLSESNTLNNNSNSNNNANATPSNAESVLSSNNSSSSLISNDEPDASPLPGNVNAATNSSAPRPGMSQDASGLVADSESDILDGNTERKSKSGIKNDGNKTREIISENSIKKGSSVTSNESQDSNRNIDGDDEDDEKQKDKIIKATNHDEQHPEQPDGSNINNISKKLKIDAQDQQSNDNRGNITSNSTTNKKSQDLQQQQQQQTDDGNSDDQNNGNNQADHDSNSERNQMDIEMQNNDKSNSLETIQGNTNESTNQQIDLNPSSSSNNENINSSSSSSSSSMDIERISHENNKERKRALRLKIRSLPVSNYSLTLSEILSPIQTLGSDFTDSQQVNRPDLTRILSILESYLTAREYFILHFVSKGLSQIVSIKLGSLKSITINTKDESAIAVSESCFALEKIAIEGSKITNKGLESLIGMNHFSPISLGDSNSVAQSQISKISITDCDNINDHGLEMIGKRCADLTEFSLDRRPMNIRVRNGYNGEHKTVVTDQGLISMTQGVCCTKLEKLYMNWVRGVSDAGMSALFQSCHRLLELYIGWIRIGDPSIVALAENNPNIEILTIRTCREITSAGFSALARHCLNIQKLCIIDCGLSDTGLQEIARNVGKKLTLLHLSDLDEITDAGINELAEVCDLLENINISHNSKISDASMKRLISKAGKSLKRLTIYWCSKVTDESIMQISLLCPNIRSIHIDGCKAITDASLIPIVKSCPFIEEIVVLNSGFTGKGAYACLSQNKTHSLRRVKHRAW